MTTAVSVHSQAIYFCRQSQHEDSGHTRLNMHSKRRPQRKRANCANGIVPLINRISKLQETDKKKKKVYCAMDINYDSTPLTDLLQQLVSWCFKPSQPQRIISGLRDTFKKRYIVERTNKTEIRPEEQTEKAESCRENLWKEIQLKGS